MKIFSAPELRNVVVAGHNTGGKTTLVGAVRGPDGKGLEVCPRVQPAGPFRVEPDGPGAVLLRPVDGVASEEVRTGGRRAPDPDRRGERLQGDSGPRPDGGSRQRGGETRGRPPPAQPGGEGQRRAREARRDGRRGGRRADGEVLRAGDPRGRRHRSRAEEGDRGKKDLPLALHLVKPRRGRPPDSR